MTFPLLRFDRGGCVPYYGMFMSLRSCVSLASAFACAAMALLSASCSSTPAEADTGAKIDKVKYYRLANAAAPIPAADPSIPFEREYHLWGAITGRQREARQGNYYAVMWKVKNPGEPLKVRFEYRQPGTGLQVKAKEQEISTVDRSNVTRFQITGPDYVNNGPVSAWRVTVVRGKQVLAEEKSYLWD